MFHVEHPVIGSQSSATAQIWWMFHVEHLVTTRRAARLLTSKQMFHVEHPSVRGVKRLSVARPQGVSRGALAQHRGTLSAVVHRSDVPRGTSSEFAA
jgi:hypothetical protein